MVVGSTTPGDVAAGLFMLVVLAVCLVVGLMIWYYPITNARQRCHSKCDAITALTWIGLFLWVTWIVALVWSYTEDNSALVPSTPGPNRRRGFPVRPLGAPKAQSLNFEDAIPDLAQTYDGPGHYEIVGVDRATKMDTTWRVEAQSRANARAKGELEGIVITELRFIG